jgi:hypothetical protein
MSFYQNLVYLLVALVMAAIFGGGAYEGTSNPSLEFLVRGWVTPSWLDLALLAACGVIASIATVLLTQAYRMAEANFVACFEYSAIIWATLGGYLFWREVPDVYFLVGAALIVAAGTLRAVPHPAGNAAGDREGLASSPARRSPAPACRSARGASAGSGPIERPDGPFLDGVGGVARIRAAADRADIHLVAADLAFGAVAALGPQAVECAGAAVVEPVVDAAAGLQTRLAIAIDADRQVFRRCARRRGHSRTKPSARKQAKSLTI